MKTKAFVEDEFIVIGCDRNEGGPPFALLAREEPDGLHYAGSAFVTLDELSASFSGALSTSLECRGRLFP